MMATTLRRRTAAWLVTALLVPGVGPAGSAVPSDYPSKPIRIIATAPPGSPPDVIAPRDRGAAWRRVPAARRGGEQVRRSPCAMTGEPTAHQPAYDAAFGECGGVSAPPRFVDKPWDMPCAQ